MAKKSLTVKELKTVLRELTPYVVGHGGKIELSGWNAQSGVLQVKLEGSCQDCPLSPITLQYGLAKTLKERFPQVKKVEAN